MVRWWIAAAGLAQIGLGWGCEAGPVPLASLDARQAACESDPVPTCQAIAQMTTTPPEAPERPYIDAMIDACPVGGQANCEALSRWAADAGSEPLGLLEDNCAAGSAASCRVASVLRAEEAPSVSRALDHLAARLEAGQRCGDPLAEAGLSTDGLELIRCAPGRVHQLAALVGEYRVAADDVDAVEARLVGETGASPMRFVCCGWESPPHTFRGEDGETYQITIGSLGETTDRSRAQMPDVAIVVSRLLEQP